MIRTGSEMYYSMRGGDTILTQPWWEARLKESPLVPCRRKLEGRV